MVCFHLATCRFDWPQAIRCSSSVFWLAFFRYIMPIDERVSKLTLWSWGVKIHQNILQLHNYGDLLIFTFVFRLINSLDMLFAFRFFLKCSLNRALCCLFSTVTFMVSCSCYYSCLYFARLNCLYPLKNVLNRAPYRLFMCFCGALRGLKSVNQI